MSLDGRILLEQRRDSKYYFYSDASPLPGVRFCFWVGPYKEFSGKESKRQAVPQHIGLAISKPTAKFNAGGQKLFLNA